MSQRQAQIELHNVSGARGRDRVAIEDASIVAYAGEVFCVLGGSRSGKSLLVELMLGLVPATSGAIRLCGLDPRADAIAARRRVTLASASGALLGRMSVAKAICFFAGLSSADVRPTEADALNALRTVGLADGVIDQQIDRVPGDMQVFLWLAIALLRRSEILLLDDPTRGMDTDRVRELQAQLLEFRARGVCVCVATADVLFASQVGDRLAVIRRGRVVSRRTRDQVLGLSLAHLYLDYVGELPGTPIGGAGLA